MNRDVTMQQGSPVGAVLVGMLEGSTRSRDTEGGTDEIRGVVEAWLNESALA